MTLLCQRWQAVQQAPPDASEAERVELSRRNKLIRLRSLAFVKMWISRHLSDFDTPGTMDALATFDELAVRAGFCKNGATMVQLVEKRRAKQAQDAAMADEDKFFFADKPPTALVPAVAVDALTLYNIEPVELARQLTLLHARLFRKIDMRDLLREAWKRKPECAVAQFVSALSRLEQWVASAVLSDATPPRAIGRIIAVCKELRALKNYNALFVLLRGFQHSALARLRKAFLAVPADAASTLADLRKLEANDYEEHRKAPPPTPPAVPHFAAALEEIEYVEASSDSRLPSGIINFRRYRHIGRVCGQLGQFQLAPFNLEPVPKVQQWWDAQLANLVDDEKLKRLSLQVEPPIGAAV